MNELQVKIASGKVLFSIFYRLGEKLNLHRRRAHLGKQGHAMASAKIVLIVNLKHVLND